MLWTIAVFFLSFWLLGVLTPSTLNGHIDIFLYLSITALLIRLLGRRHAID
jgi:hypothetical protein